jgi:hypothetical protein
LKLGPIALAVAGIALGQNPQALEAKNERLELMQRTPGFLMDVRPPN